ncbi:MAG: hypothetical protein A2293_14025 [Elusimicrobia bacterium RIFOXYB2_FULL_49_7]|nr:MAG: hypothetical protein A2293_14025 [Elusimicrobia bacterium RIFOXYB2_FULL_49_7]
MIIRLSKKMAVKIKENSLSQMEPASDPILDWHAHLFTHNRVQYVMVSHSTTLFSIFFHGQGVTDFNAFFKRMTSMLSQVCTDLGIGDFYEKAVAPNTGSVQLAKAQDKKIIGSMNDNINQAKWLLEDGDLSPYDLNFKVNKNLLSMLKYDSPEERFLALAGKPVLRLWVNKEKV